MKLDFNFNGKTLIKDWWRQVRANFTTIENAHNALDTKVTQEVADRKSADGALDGKITAEATARQTADSALDTKITQEVADRKSADGTLDGKITAEATARQAADSALDTKIVQEVADRKSADGTLDGKITAEATARQTADSALDTKIVQEVADRKSADSNHANKSANTVVLGHVQLTDTIDMKNIGNNKGADDSIAATPAAVISVVEEMYSDIASERESADSALDTKIAQEIADRKSADSTHAGKHGNSASFGHVKLTDTILDDAGGNSGVSAGIAVTPKAVFAFAEDIGGYYAKVNHTHKIQQTATVVVGTSAAGYTANDVDCLCDGTADQTEINAAINALPSGGGKVVLLEGTYNLSGQINIAKSNVTLEGMGTATLIKTAAATAICLGVWNGSYHTNINLRSLRIESASSTDAVKCHNCRRCKVTDCVITNGRGIYTDHCTDCSFTDNLLENCTDGIYIDWSSSRNAAERNRIVSCSGTGIYIGANGEQFYNKMSGNFITDTNIGINIQNSRNLATDNYIVNQTTIGIKVNGFLNRIMGGAVYHDNNYTESMYTVLLDSNSSWCVVHGVGVTYKSTVNNGADNSIS